MSARTAAETIQAAIEKLEQARALTRGGRWIADPDNPSIIMRPDDKHPNGWDGVMVAEATGDIEGPFVAELIVVLHRMIGPNLALLQECRDFYANSQAIGMPDTEMAEYYGNTVALAAAILGEES